MKQMDSGSKMLIAAFFLLLFVSAGFTYYRTMVIRAYDVVNLSSE